MTSPRSDSRLVPVKRETGLATFKFKGGNSRVPLSKPQVDVCFVFDTTGSMNNKIDALVATMTQLVGDFAALNLDWRVTTVPFGDLTVPGDRVDGKLPFVADVEAAKQQLRTLPRFYGGGNRGESSLEAMQAALAKSYRPRAVPVLVLLTDDYALESHTLTMKTVGAELTRRECIVFVASLDIPEMRNWAKRNGGEWYDIQRPMNSGDLLKFFSALSTEVSRVAKAVHQLAAGSVKSYLALESGE